MTDKKDQNSQTGLPNLEDLLHGQDRKNDRKEDGKGTATARNKKQKPLESIDDLLGTATRSDAPSSFRGADDRKRHVHQEDIDSLIRADNTPLSREKQTASKKTASHSSPLPDLESLLSPSSTHNVASHNKQQLRSKSAVTLESALADNQVTKNERRNERNDSDPQVLAKRRKVIRIGGLVTVLLLISLGIFYKATVIPVPDSEVARQLMKVVEGIEDYRETNHELPDRLSVLDAFPKDAIEFRPQHYGVQLAAPKLELFYGAHTTGYFVIARYADEAWIYREKSKQKFQKVPSR